MTATLGTLVTRLRDRLNEPSQRHWTDAQVRRWINEGAREVARVGETLLATGSVTIVAGTQTYALSALSPQPVRVHRAEYIPTAAPTQKYPLTFRRFELMDDVWGQAQAITAGTPHYYTMWGYFPSMTMYLYPTPSLAGSVKLFYYRLPTELLTDGTNDTSVVECPDGWEDVIVTYAEARAFRNDNDERWISAKAMFDEQLASLMRITSQPTDNASFITTDVGFMPAWLVEM